MNNGVLTTVMKSIEMSARVNFDNLEPIMRSNTPSAFVTEQAIRAISLNPLVLAPKYVLKTPADKFVHTALETSIGTHGLLKNLVVWPESCSRSRGKFVFNASGRLLKTLQGTGRFPA